MKAMREAWMEAANRKNEAEEILKVQAELETFYDATPGLQKYVNEQYFAEDKSGKSKFVSFIEKFGELRAWETLRDTVKSLSEMGIGNGDIKGGARRARRRTRRHHANRRKTRHRRR